MYSKIQEKKRQGYSRDATAASLQLAWRTVEKYWDMTAEAYETLRMRQYSSGLDSRKSVIVDWLERFNDLSSAQIQDWLQENYGETYHERTVRNYVAKIRRAYNLPKASPTRDYGPVPELPPGQQLQADFGQYNAIRPDKSRIRLYFAIFILSHSRYKYLVWQTRAFTTLDFIRSLESCFEALGGIPQELVIDQDRLMTVSENDGDIIHTFEFERCKNRHGFAVWLCRKADPESKGCVESGVKFVKYNFARNRVFCDLGQWSQSSQDWLERTGNGKVHAETKKIPAEVFAVERSYLKPVISLTSLEPCNPMVTTPIRKNNTIRYKGSRYSVPTGTYNLCQTASVLEIAGNLEITDAAGHLLARHQLAAAPGEQILNTNHARDNSQKIRQLGDEVLTLLGRTPQSESYLSRIQKARGRYIRDQLQVLVKSAQEFTPEIIRQAVLACVACESDNAHDFRDFANHLFRQITFEELDTERTPVPLPPARVTVPHVRDMAVVQPAPSTYLKLVRKGGGRHG